MQTLQIQDYELVKHFSTQIRAKEIRDLLLLCYLLLTDRIDFIVSAGKFALMKDGAVYGGQVEACHCELNFSLCTLEFISSTSHGADILSWNSPGVLCLCPHLPPHALVLFLH